MLSLKECVHHGFCLLSTLNSNYVQEQIVMNFLLDVLLGTVKTITGPLTGDFLAVFYIGYIDFISVASGSSQTQLNKPRM